jgi:hypothetical protein
MNPRVIALWLTIPALAFAADEGRPHGPNCDLTAPPASAGEDMNHGITLKIYPRAKDIDASYSGCQVMFAPDDGKWLIVALTQIVAGDPVRLWSDENDAEWLNCRYKNGRVVTGNPEKCPVPTSLLLKSMAAGCVAKIQDAVAKRGLGAASLKECEYQ